MLGVSMCCCLQLCRSLLPLLQKSTENPKVHKHEKWTNGCHLGILEFEMWMCLCLLLSEIKRIRTPNDENIFQVSTKSESGGKITSNFFPDLFPEMSRNVNVRCLLLFLYFGQGSNPRNISPRKVPNLEIL